MIKISKEEMEKYLYFLLDKVEECYKQEIKKSIENFLNGNY